jgi:hypothetical protein
MIDLSVYEPFQSSQRSSEMMINTKTERFHKNKQNTYVNVLIMHICHISVTKRVASGKRKKKLN